jgi:hypothetical protein
VKSPSKISSNTRCMLVLTIRSVMTGIPNFLVFVDAPALIAEKERIAHTVLTGESERR